MLCCNKAGVNDIERIIGLDNIIFERIWDSSFLIGRITAQSAHIRATVDHLYFEESDVLSLANLLLSLPFPLKDHTAYRWVSTARSEPNSDMGTEISFTITQKDRLGHMLVEVFMVIQDGDIHHSRINEDHCCRFFVQTEIGSLNDFGKRLLSFSESNTRISLVENEHA